MTTRPAVTTRGWIAGAVVASLLFGGLAVVLIFRAQGPDCTVTASGRDVGIDRGEAERASVAVAAVVRRSGSLATARGAVQAATGLDADDARAVAAALSGRHRAALVCEYGGAGDGESDRLSSAGLTARAETVRSDMASRFGSLPLGGFAPGGVTDGHMPGSAHYEGRAIDVFFRPISAPNKTGGWGLAQYLVAQADRLEINTVIFDGRIWTARRADEGWREYRVSTANRSAATVRILEHRDHVHVDVAD